MSELVAEIGENISGPFPSDTIFLKAVAGEVDAVVTVPLLALPLPAGPLPPWPLLLIPHPSALSAQKLSAPADRKPSAQMYHDQGQVAMKLLGFSKGVTVQGGLPLPITTPAHGTAFDIVGQWEDGEGKLNSDAAWEAASLCATMANRKAAAAAVAAGAEVAAAPTGGSKL